MSYRVGIIGCGRPGRGQARSHLRGYLRPDCEVVALADIVEENALALQEEFGLEEASVFTDYQEMLQFENLDVVSVCLWPHLHAPAVMAAAEAGVSAIHCEKPMAATWDAANSMVEVCREYGVQLTIGHQRRFGEPFQRARQLLKAGTIGDLVRIEACCPNLLDWGTHWLDMMHFYNDEVPAQWVMAQMEWRDAHSVFGAPSESMGLLHCRFTNGVHGLLVTGKGNEEWGARNTLIGTTGVIEVGAPGPATAGSTPEPEAVPLRVQNGEGRQEIPVEEDLHSPQSYVRAIDEVLRCLRTGEASQLDARRALRGTELVFAAYESCRSRGRVDLPLQREGSALLDLLREHEVQPAGLAMA